MFELYSLVAWSSRWYFFNIKNITITLNNKKKQYNSSSTFLSFWISSHLLWVKPLTKHVLQSWTINHELFNLYNSHLFLSDEKPILKDLTLYKNFLNRSVSHNPISSIHHIYLLDINMSYHAISRMTLSHYSNDNCCSMYTLLKIRTWPNHH